MSAGLFRVMRRARLRFSAWRRSARMAFFVEAIGLRAGERVIDLGGKADFWDGCPVPLRITIVNLPGSRMEERSSDLHDIDYVEGDACNLVDLADGSFDLCVCNSVIEHVGGPDRQSALAREARRLAPKYWVQTPSIWFPVEAHCGMPFWWFLPEAIRRRARRRWRRVAPAWSEMMEGTTVIARRDFQKMFPDARLWTERFLGFTKSYVAYRTPG